MLCWVSSVRVTCPSCLWHSRTSFLGLGEMCRNADRAEKETGQCIPKNSFYSQHLLLPRTAQPQTTSAGQAPQSWTFRIAAPVRVCHHREQHSQCRLLLSTCWSKLTPRGSMGSPTAPECEEPKCPLCHSLGGELQVFFPLQIKTAPEVTWLASSVKTPAHLLVTKQYPSCTF